MLNENENSLSGACGKAEIQRLLLNTSSAALINTFLDIKRKDKRRCHRNFYEDSHFPSDVHSNKNSSDLHNCQCQKESLQVWFLLPLIVFLFMYYNL